jgi:hypothetical protein
MRELERITARRSELDTLAEELTRRWRCPSAVARKFRSSASRSPRGLWSATARLRRRRAETASATLPGRPAVGGPGGVYVSLSVFAHRGNPGPTGGDWGGTPLELPERMQSTTTGTA